MRLAPIVALALVALTSVPYVAGATRDDPSTRFDHVIVFPQDVNAYLGFARQASQGSLLFTNPFTPEPHAPVLFNVEWLFIGWIAAIPGSSLEVGFHALRILGIVLLVSGLFRLVRQMIAVGSMRWVAVFAALLGGGFGWLRAEGLDTFAGLHPFFWMLMQPHFLIAQALSVWALIALLEERRLRAGLLIALIGLIRPFDMVVLLLSGALFTRSPAVVLPSLPVLAYQAWLFRLHPVFRWWSEQNIALPPAPTELLLGLGIVTPLVIVALFRKPWRENAVARLMLLQLVAALAALYASAPFVTFPMQFLTTVAIPATFLAASAFARAPTILLVGLLLLHSVTSWELLDAKTKGARKGRHRTEVALLDAFAWLDRNGTQDDVVLADLVTMNRLPRHAGLKSYCGYVYATVDYASKRRDVEVYYAPGASAEQRRQIRERSGARWILGGPQDDMTLVYDTSIKVFSPVGR